MSIKIPRPDVVQKTLFLVMLAGFALMALGAAMLNVDTPIKASGFALVILGMLIMFAAIVMFWLYTILNPLLRFGGRDLE